MKNKLSLIYLLFLVVIISCHKEIYPPEVEKIPYSFKYKEETISDNYKWLEEKDNKKVIDHIKKENKYTLKMMDDVKSIRKDIYEEILSRIDENEISYPFRYKEYDYYYKSIKGKEFPIYCRKNKDGLEEIISDPNKIAEKYEYLNIGFYSISPNQNKLAYIIDIDGSEHYQLWIKDLKSEKSVKFAENVTNFCWAENSVDFLYATNNEQYRTDKLYKHTGENPGLDKLIFLEEDVEFNLFVYKTRDDKYFVYDRFSSNENESYILEANNFSGNFKLLKKVEKNVTYSVMHHENDFYLLTNENAENYKLVKIIDIKNNKIVPIIEEKKDVTLESTMFFKKFIAFRTRKDAKLSLNLFFFNNKETYTIPTENELVDIFSSINPEYDSNSLRYIQESYFEPTSIRSIDVKTKKITILKNKKINFDKNKYYAKRLYVESKDKTNIPLTVLYSKSMKNNKEYPTLLMAYGAYGDSQDPYFSPALLSLLDRNIIIAIAHVRGGGDNGIGWYNDGKLLNKKNSFDDFNACAEYLKKEKISSKIIASGGSAGGMIMGVIANTKPELYDAIIADVPFVDVLNTMINPDLPLTTGEYKEWGNPGNKKYFDYIKSYSPYENVKAQDYPNILALAGWNDARVSYWEAAKWIAKIREMRTNNNLLLLYTNLNSGHSGEDGRYGYINEIAFNYAFIIKIVNKNENN